jgi:processive 1,2-diacylglycerol beta-glucosyltransferase
VIRLTDKETGRPIGEISEEHLRFLIDQLEEETEEDRDYYLNRDTLDSFREKGIDAALLEMLERAMGDRKEMEIVWKKS